MAIIYSKSGVDICGKISRVDALRHVGERNTAVINFSIKTMNKDEADKTIFIECEAWAEIAHVIEDYFKKGDIIRVLGTPKLQTWKDKTTGENRSKTVVVVEMPTMPFWKMSNFETAKNQAEENPEPENNQSDDDYELPF